jgi:hypothetical protein
MYDAINASAVPTDGDLYAGYDDGNWPSASALATRFPGKTVVHITVNPNDNQGVVGDGPPDNGAWDEWVNWVLKRRAAGVDPTVYTNKSSWVAGVAAFKAAGVAEPHWWIAQYDNDPTIPVGAVGKQYASIAAYDTSSVVDYWPGVDPAPTTPPPSGSIEEDKMYLYVAPNSNEANAPKAVFALGNGKYVHVADPGIYADLLALGWEEKAINYPTHAWLLVAYNGTPAS